MHVCFVAFWMVSFAHQATHAAGTEDIHLDQGESWVDELRDLLCWIGQRYGLPCDPVIDSPLPVQVQQLEDAFRSVGPQIQDPEGLFVNVILTLKLVDAHHDQIEAPTADQIDALLTEIYLVEGGDPIFLP